MDIGLDILWWIFPILGAIMILVFVHEMGHFLFAKLFGMRVDKFSVGFPPKVVGKTVGETEYVIGATPLGGYVKIAGMVDESMDTDWTESEPEPWEFRAKPVWQRIVVITAGVIFNVILAFGIYAALNGIYGERYIPAENVGPVYVQENSLLYDMGLRTGDEVIAVNGEELERFGDLLSIESLLGDPFAVTVRRDGETLTFTGPDDIMTQLQRREGALGLGIMPSIIGRLMEGSAADDAGLRPGDRIVAINGAPTGFWYEMTDQIQASEGQAIRVRFERADSLVASEADAARLPAPVARKAGMAVYEAEVAPRYHEETERYLLGVEQPTDAQLAQEFGERAVRYSAVGALAAGARDTWRNTKAIAISLKRVFTGRDNFRENVGGPVKIAEVTKEAAQRGGRTFWNIVAMLSITLAIMNILPIPALDGGHLMFLLYEAVTRREPSLRVRMAMQQVGMILLLAFMTFLIFNDILRL